MTSLRFTRPRAARADGMTYVKTNTIRAVLGREPDFGDMVIIKSGDSSGRYVVAQVNQHETVLMFSPRLISEVTPMVTGVMVMASS